MRPLVVCRFRSAAPRADVSIPRHALQAHLGARVCISAGETPHRASRHRSREAQKGAIMAPLNRPSCAPRRRPSTLSQDLTPKALSATNRITLGNAMGDHGSVPEGVTPPSNGVPHVLSFRYTIELPREGGRRIGPPRLSEAATVAVLRRWPYALVGLNSRGRVRSRATAHARETNSTNSVPSGNQVSEPLSTARHAAWLRHTPTGSHTEKPPSPP